MKKIFLLLCVAYIAMSCEHENEKYTAQYIRNETKNRIKVTFYLNDSIKWDGIGQLLIDGLILLPGSMSYGKDTKLVDFSVTIQLLFPKKSVLIITIGYIFLKLYIRSIRKGKIFIKMNIGLGKRERKKMNMYTILQSQMRIWKQMNSVHFNKTV